MEGVADCPLFRGGKNFFDFPLDIDPAIRYIFGNLLPCSVSFVPSAKQSLGGEANMGSARLSVGRARRMQGVRLFSCLSLAKPSLEYSRRANPLVRGSPGAMSEGVQRLKRAPPVPRLM